MIHRSAFSALCVGLLFAALTGCGPNQAKVAPPETPAVPVSQPLRRKVTDAAEFTGRTDAPAAIDVRARVTGFLKKTHFEDGADVKEGDLLFEIDPRPYQAQYNQAKGQVILNEASLRYARITYERDRSIATRSPGAVTAQQIDQDRAAVEEADARVKAYQASLEVYAINLEYTKVHSPINGQASRSYLTPGNLVSQDQTLLTTIVSLDSMNVYFDMDEPTLLRIRRAINEGKIVRFDKGVVPVRMGLQGDDGYPHLGKVTFVNNQVSPTTGSISVRGVFPNPLPKNGVRLLSPGMFVRIQLPIGQPYDALLVVDRAIASDQGLKYVYVLGPDNKVEYRRITTGPLQEDGLRVISSGLKADEWVVVGGLQQVRPRMPIEPQKTTMQPPSSTASPRGPR